VLAVLTALAGLLAVATLLPFLPIAHGIVRMGDFPRQQILVLAAIVVPVALWALDAQAALAIAGVCMVVIAVQAWHIVEFTPLWRRETADYVEGRDKGQAIRLVVCNVKMSNRRFAELEKEIAARDPDLFVLMEVDDSWAEALGELIARYPHTVLRPQDNSYGMILCSKFKLADVGVECLLTDGVPSIIATVHCPDGQAFRFYAIHPEPPVPHRGTEGRDGETAHVALKVRDEHLPVIVTGDLNDVAWSGTTRRFRKISRLLDPRVGRRVFSTFDARLPLIRWPLDHLFHAAEFRLRHMERLPRCGSDHFPVMFDLVLCPEEKAEARPEAANGADLDRARELERKARDRDEEAIGTDWE
jgi:endonuclease/exonuclease/phosphatase (EEP) superfamily protein YafD